MSIESHLLHTCTIQRPTTTQQDGYGQAVKVWGAVAISVACRLVTKSQKILSDDRRQLLTVTVYKLLVGSATDVREDDRITELALESGVEAVPYRVAAILPRRSRAIHHITLDLEKVS